MSLCGSERSVMFNFNVVQPEPVRDVAKNVEVTMKVNRDGHVELRVQSIGATNGGYTLVTMQTNGTILRHSVTSASGWKRNDRGEAIFTRNAA